MKALFILLQYLVPQQLFTRFIGLFGASTFGPWKNLMIRCFIRSYDVDMSQAEQPDYRAYSSFNDFFTRALRPGVRPIAGGTDGRTVVSPADGTVSAIGRIEGGRLFQAKGRDFSLLQLLGGSRERAAPFENGRFATIYLSPRDYHRVHMPLAGTLRETVFIPGRLFSVNQATAESIPGLFARNERLVCLFDSAAGPMAVILVGAMIVGSIETVWEGEAARAPAVRSRDYRASEPRIGLDTGAELGRFKMGSTVIVLFGPAAVDWSARLGPLSQIEMGQELGTLI